MESMDLIVIGAGLNGLPVAKTYQEVHPTAKVLIIEAAKTIGGTWAKHRLYPGLTSNTKLGMYELSDFPMDEATFGVKPGQFIPGNVIHEYLRKYAEHFAVYRLIRFGVTVEKVESGGSDGGWILTTTKTGSSELSLLRTRKLVIATGLTSDPKFPSIPESHTFSAPIFHSKDFLQNASTFDTAKSITVLGGNKSAWDVCYGYASRGVHVDMIIRSSGHGPTLMAPPYVTPLKIWLMKMIHTRFLTWFSPCVWGEVDGFGGFMRRILHGTGMGRWIVRKFFSTLADDLMTLNGYDKHPETAKLKPWSTDTFWIGGSGLSALNYQTDFFELVRSGMIKVHIADVTHLSAGTVHLDTGVELPTDALICATGWKYKPSMEFVPESLQLSMGLPSAVDKDPTLTLEADAEVLRIFPSLRDQPPPNSSYEPLSMTDPTYTLTPMTPYRLYRFMVPPAFVQDRSIAFAGIMISVSTPLIAQIQALWITSYVSPSLHGNEDNDGSLPIPNSEQAMHETLLHTEFLKLRYPQGQAARFPDFSFDALPYLDLLLRDLGLNGRRKGWWRDWFSPYGPEDYKGLVGEWLLKRG